MLFDLPNDDILYRALIERDPAYDGFAYVGVKTTGVFCRLTCPARKPKRENSTFYSSVVSAMEAGFRPCKRCCPLMLGGQKDPLVFNLLRALENSPEKRWSEADVQALNVDPSTVRRAFKRQFGITFLEMARLRRIGKGVETLTGGNQVIDAQLDAHYESGSGFRAAIVRQIGLSPSYARKHQFLKADWLETPIGTMLAISDDNALYLLEFIDRPALENEIEKLRRLTGSEIIFGSTPTLEQLSEELTGYFSAKNQRFTIQLAELGSLFTRKVWDVIKTVPAGELRSYAELAKEINQPTATRAVARANGANQISIIIPCHRVIGADGQLTGYGGGLWRKRWLIEHERRMTVSQSNKGYQDE